MRLDHISRNFDHDTLITLRASDRVEANTLNTSLNNAVMDHHHRWREISSSLPTRGPFCRRR